MTLSKAQSPPSLPIADAPPLPWVILVVDDEPDSARSLQKLLEQSIPGSEVLKATSGAEGLGMLDRVDLIVSDYRMPEMDGIGFLAHCLRNRPSAIRILLTAFPGPEPVLENRARHEAHVAGFVWKGLGPQAIVDAVRKAMVGKPAVARP